MARRLIAALALVALSAPVVPSSVSAVSVDTPTLTCLTTKYGAKVAGKIRAAKKLNAAQNRQLASCKASGGGASTSEVKAMNLCTSQDLTSAAKVSGTATSLTVSLTGNPNSTNCVYLLLGASRFII